MRYPKGGCAIAALSVKALGGARSKAKKARPMDFYITCFTFGLFLVIFLWVGALAAQVSTDRDADYLLGDRSFGRVFIALSAGATGNSGFIMVGAVGIAYSMGISAFLMVLASCLGELTFWMLFPGKINRISSDRDSKTVPELLGGAVKQPQGKRIVTAIAALISVVFVGTYTAAQFSAAAKTLNVFWGIEPHLGVAIAAASILVYCVTGGLRASIWTDIVQSFVVMFVCFGMLTVAIRAGGGVWEIISQLHQIDPQLMNITAEFSGWTLVAYLVGFFFFGIGFDLSQPQFLVRLLAGRSPTEAAQARWIYLIYVYSTWSSMVAFGIVCRVLIPDISDPEQALSLYAMQNFNPWLVGIILAGIFSVIASTADSQLLVCSSALGRDLFPYLETKMSKIYGVKYQQFITLLVGIVAAIATIYLSATVFSLSLFAVGALAGSIGPAMLIAILKRRTHALAFISTMLVGLMTALAWEAWVDNQIINEIFPSFLMALFVHELLMKTVFKKAVG